MQTVIDDPRSTQVDHTESACFAILWVQGVEDETQSQQILQEVDNHDGVRAARFSRTNPYLLIVDYDPARTRVTGILDVINGPGTRAKLVGC